MTKSPAEEAVEILRRELPGFEAQVSYGTHEIRVRTTFKFSAGRALEWPELDLLVPGGGVAEWLRPMIEQTRRAAAEKLGLAAEIERQVTAARDEAYARGRREGRADGLTVGRAEGERAVLARILGAPQ